MVSTGAPAVESLTAGPAGTSFPLSSTEYGRTSTSAQIAGGVPASCMLGAAPVLMPSFTRPWGAAGFEGRAAPPQPRARAVERHATIRRDIANSAWGSL